jgi:hypothetical protein
MKNATILATMTVAALAGTTLADTINARFTGVSPGQTVSVRYDGHNMNTQAGVFNFLRSASNPGTLPGFAPTFQGFCIDLTESVSNGHDYSWSTYSLANAPTSDAGAMGATRAARLGRLFANQYAALATAASQAQAYAAFQLAVWEIVHDSGLDLDHGNFKVNNAPSGTEALAQSWLNNLGSGQGWNLIAIDDASNDCDGHQGYVLVPAPGAAALVGVGLVASGRRRRRV